MIIVCERLDFCANPQPIKQKERARGKFVTNDGFTFDYYRDDDGGDRDNDEDDDDNYGDHFDGGDGGGRADGAPHVGRDDRSFFLPPPVAKKPILYTLNSVN